jgi:hypothetical protein
MSTPAMTLHPALVFTNTLAHCSPTVDVRRQILENYYVSSPYFEPHVPRHFSLEGVIACNADINLDLAVAWRMHLHYGDTRYWHACRALYGVTDLVTGASRIPTSAALP